MRAGYAISKSTADPMRLSTKMLEKVKLPGNYDGVSIHALLAWVHLKFCAKEAPKYSGYRMHWDPIVNSAISDWDRREREQEVGDTHLLRRFW